MATKTITLTGAEVAVNGLDGANAHIRNDGTDVIYAAKAAGISAGADGVLSIPAGQAATVYGISGTVYMLGTGSAQIISNDYSELPFKTSTASGGSAVDEQARTAINAHSGNAEIHVTADEKTAWDGKADVYSTVQIVYLSETQTDTKVATGQAGKITIYRCMYWTDVPSAFPDGQGTLIAINYVGNGTAGTDSIWCEQFIISPRDEHRIFRRIIDNTTVSEWKDYRDGGNAATLDTHPASDFVLKTDYDALAARVAALEGGTT